tara:strand:- start:248 stop:619 length:372 start_codon:yes stop_codon:yes gene_type:complete
MKKLTLSIGLLAGILTSNAQDTTCTYFNGKRVIEFDYQTSKVLYEVEQNSKYYKIDIKYGNVLCLDLNDEVNRVRKVKIIFFDGTSVTETVKSKDNVYYSPRGTVELLVGKPKLMIIGKPYKE